MNKTEIATVERLRREGKGLSAIAKETGISINTIKSHFSRHGVPAPRLIRVCLFCTAEIKTTDHFCSDACRAGWYESHSSDEQDILRPVSANRVESRLNPGSRNRFTARNNASTMIVTIPSRPSRKMKTCSRC